MKKTATWKQRRVAKFRERKRLARMEMCPRKTSSRLKRRARLKAVAPVKLHVTSTGKTIRRHELTPPDVLDLEGNYAETIKFLKNLRFATSRRGNFHIEMKGVKDISPAAALLLVAECDRWRELTKSQWLRAESVSDWEPSVRRRLKEMGFFKVLNTRSPPDDPFVAGEDRYVPFLTGTRNPGAPAFKLQEEIEALGPSVADPGALYEGLVEAMTNVAQHAYSSGKGEFGPKRWWISASVNEERHSMTVLVVDHGVGIAKTLPRSKVWERIRQAVPLEMLNDDAEIVLAAFTKGGEYKSQTGEEHRGKGLRENIKGYVESHNSRGRLRVITNRAGYTYSRNNNDEEEASFAVPVPFDGTFIEWVIEDYGQERNENN
ncbi:ATP-binding protein [Stenotrophomonas maltophilia]|uniref:ATP-binding protein n=1 Tax=Stenotrophomonas maltophilia TaxID=40324 RepID=UPI0013110D40|nr:ATP-binding protein [Stenotrophomonas maltophilia]